MHKVHLGMSGDTNKGQESAATFFWQASKALK